MVCFVLPVSLLVVRITLKTTTVIAINEVATSSFAFSNNADIDLPAQQPPEQATYLY